MAMLVLLLAAVSMIVLYAPAARPQPARVRRNTLQEELLASYVNQRAEH